MTRKFKLINANGAEWNLMRPDGFLYDPNGLGIAKDNEYMRIGTTYELVQQLSAQKQVSFVMIFSSYSVYRSFADFIVNTPLKLAYNPATEWAYIDGEITSLGKTEFNHGTFTLECSATFTATSLWYIPRAAQRTSDVVEHPKRYTYQYDYTYADESNGYIRVINNGSQNSPAKISIMGQITDPAWYVSVNNDVIASGSVTANIPHDHKLVVNSKDGLLEVSEYVTATNEFVRNLYQATDFSKETFVMFPPGNSVLFVSGIAEGPINAWIEIEEIHETV